MSTPNMTLREKATFIMDEALKTPDGLNVVLPVEEINSIRSLCYAVREQDRIFKQGESDYDRLSFHLSYGNGIATFVLRLHSLPTRARVKRSRRLPG